MKNLTKTLDMEQETKEAQDTDREIKAMAEGTLIIPDMGREIMEISMTMTTFKFRNRKVLSVSSDEKESIVSFHRGNIHLVTQLAVRVFDGNIAKLW